MKPLYIIAACLLVGCGPTAKLKRAQRLINSAIENGARVDSLTKVVHDTIRIPEIRDDIRFIRLVDTVRLVEKCIELARKPSIAKVTAIQEVICPDVAIDTTYQLALQIQGRRVAVPIEVAITSNKGGFSYAIRSKEMKFDFESEKTTVGVSSGFTLWGLIWRCALSVLVALIVGFVIGRFTKISV